MADLVGLHNGRRAFTPWGHIGTLTSKKKGVSFIKRPLLNFRFHL